MEENKTDYKLPRLFGKYYLLELINVGGMAEVFKAKMFGVEGFEKIVAIKKILPEVAEDAEFIKMFIDEAKIAVRLQHPNIVQILELGKIDDSYFIAMELVNGKDLKTIRKRLKRVELLMPVEQSAYIISQVCDGLDYAHRKTDDKMNSLNIVHRDISPQNMIVSYEGTVKLIDFGIAKAKSKSTKTQAGMLKGKFSYMSPEQVSGQPIDRRSDIFSLGVVFFEMLTGKRLFLGKNDVETLEKIRKADVPPPSVFNSNVPPELDRIVLKALSKDREERYQWASEFSEDLKKFSFTTGNSFSRQDMMNFMSEFFADELEEETAKLEEYQKIQKPVDHHQPQHYNDYRQPSRTEKTHHDTEMSMPKRSKKVPVLIAVLLVLSFLAYFGFTMLETKKDTATILIDSSEKNTIVMLNEGTMYQKRCETPCKIEGILPGDHQIELTKSGFVPVKETVSLRQGEVFNKSIKMFKIGEQKTMITVKTDPEGAVLYVNDVKAKALSPTVVDDIPVGLDIVIRIEKQGYFPYEENIGKVPAKVNKEISIILKPMKNAPAIPLQTNRKAEKNKPSVNAKEQAFISINSRPWANVYINGKLVKATPIIKHSLPAGSYKIQFKNPKFNIDKTFPVDLKPGEHQRMIKNFD
ncbi:MAG TPA: serine/threonine-protein kinase [bacterium]|nr:serine/threonine protein kinase [bacterium]MDX9804254.1 serine/threonine-protein kinase [bacterium]HNZ52948.1 serine/threonine-protein kinase [bacterium]HOG42543.1 serine/threonine-protein kinase [bacterium]HPG35096.1 serine/threonine-protein kinase [bacterium]